MTAARGGSRVSHLDQSGSWLVEFEGVHDIATIPRLERLTRGIWPRSTLAVVDLSAAIFIDCSFAGSLVHTRDALGDNASVARPRR